MRNVVRSEEMGDNYYDNEITRSIDSQIVTAPQYGMSGVQPQLDPPNPPKNKMMRRNAHRMRRRNITKGFRYDVRADRTKALKRNLEILELLLAEFDAGKCNEQAEVVSSMRARLELMRSEMARRNLRDLAGGKMQNRGSFYSLGARARAA